MLRIDYEGSRWQEEFWPGRDYEDLAERRALVRLLPPQGEALVDIGAGFGRTADLYRGYRRIVLIDAARSQLQQARDRLGQDPRFAFATADIYRLPLADQAFDTAVIIRLLHHLRNIPQALAEVHRVLRPRGAFILEYSNKRNLKEILRWLFGRSQKRPFSPEPVEFMPGNFNFHPRYITQSLRSTGFIVSRELAVSQFRLPILKRIMSAKTLARLDGLFQVPGGWLRLSPSVFVSAQAANTASPLPNPSSSLFQCPYDRRGELIAHGERLTCPYCGREWLPEDGIYNFRVAGSA